MNEAGLRVPSGYIYPIANSRQAGRQALKTVLNYDHSISAVVLLFRRNGIWRFKCFA